ncbi:cadherin-87A-like [Ruditapes philippinarum]|uniref:cadherin-87A-like n=1 Tax=Ruditapes philippinarum TaxID=129788 RepID=UPI00295A77C3|nr:cadherin-87A-like [Ruditapes philippinarum]
MATEYRATFTMDTVTGVVKLERNLDYEKHNIYHFNITATDENGNGKTSEYAVLTIRVLDVQDTPPIFTSGSYTAVLHNNFEVNSLVITVNALDGDTGYSPLNDVDYSILQGPCSELFSIDKQGDIRTTKPIGDNTQAFEPSCVLTVSAQEVDVDPSKQYGSTKTETTVRMVLESKELNHESCSSGTTFNAIMSIYFAVAAVSLMLKTS